MSEFFQYTKVCWLLKILETTLSILEKLKCRWDVLNIKFN